MTRIDRRPLDRTVLRWMTIAAMSLVGCASGARVEVESAKESSADFDPAMHRLAVGVHQFQAEEFDRRREVFQRLADHQSPIALFITCSDSRIDPCLLTRTGPGDLFILRNAGDLVPVYHGPDSGGEAATIEYAVEHLGVRDIIVCGHSNCGAMKGLLHPEELSDLPAVRGWLENAKETRDILAQSHEHLAGAELLTVAIQENVLVQIEHLRTHPTVTAALKAGKLHLHGWIYRIETGEVFDFDPNQDRFVPLTIASASPTMLDHWVRTARHHP